MAFQYIPNIAVKGMAACVPKKIEDNRELSLFETEDDRNKFIQATGILKRHTVKGSDLCASDLCFQAAETLLAEIGWERSEIGYLIFVSQTPDYIFPATACILQNRLGLSQECYAMDISLGCSGWVYGLTTIASLLSSSVNMKKGLLLVGDTTTITKSPKDKSTYPLFGDAGTATAVQYEEGSIGLKIHAATDGSSHKAIMIPDGGFRNFFSSDSLVEHEIEPGIVRNSLQSILDGPGVFTFGITKAPKSISGVLEYFDIKIDAIDYLVLHQANKMMNEKIRKKLKIEPEKVPYSLPEYGNTSSSSIPLTMVSQLCYPLRFRHNVIVACGFGVGLSWASVILETNKIVCPPVIEI
ncbi:MAG: ketoacyl-ACP synthase III [Imperialibacter sp.]|uniref:3-oxoacyl-ACP synthase III family protein n=1 Tax=Imperialibacter sp. TaxID=2038411 RepID=UPI0032EA996C